MRLRLFRALPWAVLMTAAMAAAATAGVEERLTEQNDKCRITVGEIKAKAGECDQEMAAAVGEMLSTALANEDRFVVLASQEEVRELAGEIELAESGLVEEGRGAERGLMEGADVLVTGAVTSFEPEASGGGGLLGAAKKKLGGEVGVRTNTAKCGLDLKLVDVRTRRVIKAFNVEAKSTGWETGLKGRGWVEDVALGGALGSYSNQPMEDAIRAVLVKAVDKVAKEVPQEYFRYAGDGQYTQEYGAGGGGGRAGAGGATAADEGSRGEPAAGGAGAAGGSGHATTTVATTGGAAGAAGPVAEDMTLFKNYDFVPGDQVIFLTDYAGEEGGEFPARWGLENGVLEVARMGGRNWVLCSDSGRIYPKLANLDLPDAFTIEMEIYDNGDEVRGHWYHLLLVQQEDEVIDFVLGERRHTRILSRGHDLANKELLDDLTRGQHTLRIMVTPTTIKCYVDQERVGNIPKPDGFDPDRIEVRLDPHNQADNPMLMGTFRVAAGGRKLREQLDRDGKIVTHGILFDSGSAVIKGESYKTLADLGALLEDDAALRLAIEGHTDADGADDANLALSQRRAEAVKGYLVSALRVDGSRLEARGKGEAQPIDTNATAEGKANNRRVELLKI